MSVAEAQSKIDSREFAEWIAFFRISPYGPWREDLRMATICSTMANVWRSSSSRSFTPQEFMPDFTPKQPQTVEDMQHRILVSARSAGFEIIDKRPHEKRI